MTPELSQFDYTTLAQRHKPTDQAALARAVRDLHSQRLTASDIADLLALSVPAVAALLQRVPNAPGARGVHE